MRTPFDKAQSQEIAIAEGNKSNWRSYGQSLKIARLANFFLGLSSTGHISSPVARSLEQQAMSDYLATVADPFGLFTRIHDDRVPVFSDSIEADKIDAHLAMDNFRWAFDDYLHLPQNLNILSLLRSGVEIDMTSETMHDPSDLACLHLDNPSILENQSFGHLRYANMTNANDISFLRDLWDQLGFNLFDDFRDAYVMEHLCGVASEQSQRKMFSNAKLLAFANFNNDSEIDFLPYSHYGKFGDLEFFCRHPVSQPSSNVSRIDLSKGQYTTVVDPIGRCMQVRDLMGFVDSINKLNAYPVIESAKGFRLKLRTNGHYKNTWTNNRYRDWRQITLLVDDNMDPVGNEHGPLAFMCPEFCAHYKQRTYDRAKFRDVSTLYKRNLAAREAGYTDSTKFMTDVIKGETRWRQVNAADYFNANKEYTEFQPNPYVEFDTNNTGATGYVGVHMNYINLLINGKV